MTDAPHSVYRPTPEAPSPWWLVAARRLGWVATALRVALPVGIVASALSAYGRAALAESSSGGVVPVLYVSSILQWLRLGATSLVWIVAFAAIARLPLPHGARRLAHVALGFGVFDLLRPLAANVATMMVLRSVGTSVTAYTRWSVAMQIVGFVIDLAGIAVSTAALVRLARVASPARVSPLLAWALAAVALEVWMPLYFIVESIARAALPFATWGLFALSAALSTAYVVGWTRVLRGLADDVAAQTAPDVTR